MKLYRIRVQAEVVATFIAGADSPEDAASQTFSLRTEELKWLTPGRVVAIEEKTPEGWRALTPEESAVVEALE